MEKAAIRQLERIVGKKNVLTAKEHRIVYSYDAKEQGEIPMAVVRPDSTEQVATVLAWCNENRMPVIPRGAGTGAVGGAITYGNAIILEMARMNGILELSADEQLARVQAGVVTKDLDSAAGEHGLIYAPDPASWETSTIGGNAATCAGGLRAVRYGVTKHHILGAVVALADGRIIRTGVRTKKGVVGYDMTELFVGSEGTLGVICELTVRLLPKPEKRKTLIAIFPDLATAGKCVISIMQTGVIPTVCEIMDRKTLSAVKQNDDEIPDYKGDLLLIEITGRQKQVEADSEIIEGTCRNAGAGEVITAKSETEAEMLWKARKGISPALYNIRPGKVADDITVPIPKIPEMFEGLKKIAEQHELEWAAYGHAGDGNIHANFLLDKSDENQMAQVKKARVALYEKVLELGGTISGEHGIGHSKMQYLPMEQNVDEIDVQLSIKKALDPNNILNPGKVFPEKHSVKVEAE